MKNKQNNPLALVAVLVCWLLSAASIAQDVDADGANAAEEARAGTSDTNPDERPYWWKTVYETAAVPYYFGFSVSAAGDVNGDGYGDVVVGAPFSNIVGSAQVLSGVDGSELYRFFGVAQFDGFGLSVGDAGDVNGDGYADIVVGSPGVHQYGPLTNLTGRAQVFSGLDGSILHSFNGNNDYEYFGAAVSAAGDINNDGYDDVIVGAYSQLGGDDNSETARVFSGIDGAELYAFDVGHQCDEFSVAVSDAGDINKDGFDDVIVGTNCDYTNVATRGSARVFSGADGSQIYVFYGDEDDANFGRSVSYAGDVNNDGYTDLIVGGLADYSGEQRVGGARVFSGLDGSEIYTLTGSYALPKFGYSVSDAGDVNGDGYGDLIVGSGDFRDQNQSAGAWLFSGVDGTVLYKLDTANEPVGFGISVSGAGDLNADGYADVVVGAPVENGGLARVYLSSDLFQDQDIDFIVNSADTDIDGDGMPNSWEASYGFDPLQANGYQDSDGDGATNLQEYESGWQPLVVDNDLEGDGINDVADNCPAVSNPLQLDTDRDGLGDICDTDVDGDAMPDSWELLYGLNPLTDDAGLDSDGDGWSNLYEYQHNNNPILFNDADVDGASDYEELLANLNPYSSSERQPYWWRTLSGGQNVSAAGDVNGDGYDDVAIGSYSGGVRVVSGVGASTLYTIDNSRESIFYAPTSDWTVINGVGDINNDGYSDIGIGGQSSAGVNAAKVLSGVDGSTLYAWYGDSGMDFFGGSIADIGDINNDNHIDIAVSGVTIDHGGYIKIFSGDDGSVLRVFNVGGTYPVLYIDGVGDINDDGYDDFIVGGRYSGVSALYSGYDGSAIYSFEGVTGEVSARYAGDVNKDGYGDFILGGQWSDGVGSSDEEARVFSGVDGSLLYAFGSDAVNIGFGSSVSGAGDVNGDGYPDLVVGAYADDVNGDNSGSAKIFSGFNGTLLYTLVGDNAGDRFGWSVSGAGDMDGDGYGDLIVGTLIDGAPSNARLFLSSDLRNDVDTDFIINSADADDDNDGTPDLTDAFPLDPTETLDTDGDTIGNNADWDDDGDAVLDSVDSDPLDAGETAEIVLPAASDYRGGRYQSNQ